MYVTGGGDFNPQKAEFLAIGIDTNLKSTGAYGDLLDPLEWAYKQYGGDLRNYPRITKEEFYTLE